MDNAVNALKMGFGIFVFVAALSLAIMVVSEARQTADFVLALNDKTYLYDYVDETAQNAVSEERIVGLETILPTIYRYAKEQYAVTIIDKSGKIIVRYDLYTEGFMNNWDEVKKNIAAGINSPTNNVYDDVRNKIGQIDSFIGGTRIWDAIDSGELYRGFNSNLGAGQVSVAPWIVDPNTDTIDRINADLSGGTYEKNGIMYYGKNLNAYKNSRFKERFIEIQTSGTTITADGEDFEEYSLETVKGNKKLEIFYEEQ